ncbi:MAG: hypothetical protein EPN93_19080 [Spirochaetes bacterium]|nr:MAG: hypothetical protein EPN93_19080 [Spirochaetota bacterium]
MLVAPAVLAAVLSCATAATTGQRIQDALPRESDLPGWKLRDAPRSFQGTDISLLGPEKAALAARFRLEAAARMSFVWYSDPGRELSLELYEAPSALDAFGLMGRLDPIHEPEGITVANADDACCTDRVLRFRKGRFCGIVSVGTGSREARKDMLACAESVCAALMSTGERLPSDVDTFGGESDRFRVSYYPEGLGFIPSSGAFFMRRRIKDGLAISVIYARKDSPGQALREFTGALAGSGALELRDAGTRRIAQKRLEGGGVLMITIEREWIFGVTDAPDERVAAATIEKLREELPPVPAGTG